MTKAITSPVMRYHGAKFRLANQLNITVMSTFNGVRLMACPGDDAEGLEEAWRRELAQVKAYQSIARDIYFCNPEFPDGKPATNTTTTGGKSNTKTGLLR